MLIRIIKLIYLNIIFLYYKHLSFNLTIILLNSKLIILLQFYSAYVYLNYDKIFKY